MPSPFSAPNPCPFSLLYPILVFSLLPHLSNPQLILYFFNFFSNQFPPSSFLIKVSSFLSSPLSLSIYLQNLGSFSLIYLTQGSIIFYNYFSYLHYLVKIVLDFVGIFICTYACIWLVVYNGDTGVFWDIFFWGCLMAKILWYILLKLEHLVLLIRFGDIVVVQGGVIGVVVWQFQAAQN